MTIRTLIRDTLANGHYEIPANAAEDVLAKIPGNELAEYLRDAIEALAPSIASELSRQRFHAARNTGFFDTNPQPVDPVKAKHDSSYSAKVAAIREQHLALLETSLNIAPGVWIPWGDATAEDLRAAARKRRESAAALAAEAEHYDEVAALLERRGVRRVRDLADEDLRSLAA